jgi:hypothetical protein
MTRNPSLFGWFFGRKKRRRPARKTPKARVTPKAKTPKTPKPKAYRGAATEKMAAARRRQKTVPRIYSDKYVSEVLAGKHGAEALRKLLSQARTARRNPGAPGHLESLARRQSRTFHGAGHGDILELSPAEQRRYHLPRYVVPLGRQNAIEYVAPAGSKRSGAVWRHRARDRGPGRAPAREAPWLVADPRDGRTLTIGGAQRFSPAKGIVG